VDVLAVVRLLVALSDFYCRLRARTCSAVAVCQIRTVLSLLPETRNSPFGEKARAVMRLVCPLSANNSTPVSTAQIRMLRSAPADASLFPSGEKTSEKSSPLWPLSVRNLTPVSPSRISTLYFSSAVAKTFPSKENSPSLAQWNSNTNLPLRASSNWLSSHRDKRRCAGCLGNS